MAPFLIAAALEIAKMAAPKLVGALTGSDQAAGVAERLVGMAQEVTGTGTPDEAIAKLKADPNLVLQLNLRAQEIEAELEKAYLADRQSARQRDIELAKAGMKNERANWMVVLDAIGLISCLAILIFFQGELPGEVIGIVSTVAGIFGACLRDAHQFEFGSSRGSKEKDELFARQITAQGDSLRGPPR
jgi:hypothetical protein